ncbi:MAG TPA: hypothetical protein VKH44_01530 [Pirellulaceae bacterium]|nr:hypothetical protein [Pirellulaceae bacterium]
MSNPLLRPNDPRFQKPDVRDAEGKNRFGESGEKVDSPDAGNEVYAAATTDEVRPFVPRYDVQQRSRAGLLLFLGGLGWAAAVIGGISLAGLFNLGWISPLLGVIPAGAAWFLAHEELKAIELGAIAAEARSPARHAYWLGLTALIACLGIVAAMIYRQMHFLPDV